MAAPWRYLDYPTGFGDARRAQRAAVDAGSRGGEARQRAREGRDVGDQVHAHGRGTREGAQPLQGGARTGLRGDGEHPSAHGGRTGQLLGRLRRGAYPLHGCAGLHVPAQVPRGPAHLGGGGDVAAWHGRAAVHLGGRAHVLRAPRAHVRPLAGRQAGHRLEGGADLQGGDRGAQGGRRWRARAAGGAGAGRYLPHAQQGERRGVEGRSQDPGRA